MCKLSLRVRDTSRSALQLCGSDASDGKRINPAGGRKANMALLQVTCKFGVHSQQYRKCNFSKQPNQEKVILPFLRKCEGLRYRNDTLRACASLRQQAHSPSVALWTFCAHDKENAWPEPRSVRCMLTLGALATLARHWGAEIIHCAPARPSGSSHNLRVQPSKIGDF